MKYIQVPWLQIIVSLPLIAHLNQPYKIKCTCKITFDTQIEIFYFVNGFKVLQLLILFITFFFMK